ncbi:MAG: hypothetical protein ONB32_09165 [candidate division KSB1 bacterium]|nr:hypothetical protein [candidate division KSB1 bacterium]MDZ7399069.1 hypothetical protein [candidate division KSB1 bacterium]
MKKINLMLLFLTISLFAGYAISLAAVEGGKKSGSSLAKASAPTKDMVNRTLVNIGQVAMWIYADGTSANEPSGNSGVYFPRGSTPKTPFIFQDGLIWGGIMNDGLDPRIRVGGQAYSTGTVPGRIISKGVGENINDAENVYRIWRIRRDFATVSDEALVLDAAEVFDMPAASVTAAEIEKIRNIYRNDWIDWPAYKGAPFYDADGDGKYTPKFNPDGTPILYPQGDEPGYANGDQVVWLVCNDLNQAATIGLYGSPPMGIEMQLTLWAYKRTDPLGNIIFKEFRLIYKGRAETPDNAVIDSMYVCQWSDPDNGEAGDDYAGCDTTLSLGYVYNATSQDPVYSQAGFPPPAGGYDFFAGPRVPHPGGSAVWHLKRINDYVNLPMTSFAFFAAGQIDSDPDRGGPYTGTQQWWNLLRGYRPRPIAPPERWTNPITGEKTMYRVPGDPVTGTGWIDSNAGDRRILLVSGPFEMAFGDTAETVIALLGAMGSDRLSSISVLKFYDRFAQEAFDVLFELPKAPPAPKLQATEFDGKIFLNWGYDAAGVAEVENFTDKGFVFEGYNLYQLPTAGAAVSQGIKLATYDVVNEVTTITQETFDVASGLVLNLPVQIGKNSGIKRTATIDYDRFREKPLANGRTYYFAVTSYSYNPDPTATIKSLESTLSVVQVVPQTLKPGVRLQAEIDQQLEVTHVGPSDGTVAAIVKDPTKLTGDEYKVTFSELEGETVWHLVNVTKNKTVLANQTNQSGDENYLIADGVQVIVQGPPPGVKDEGYLYYPPQNRWVTAWSDPSGAAPLWHLEGWNGLIGWGANFFGSSVPASQLKNIQIRFAATDENGNILDPNDPNVSMAYRYLRAAANPPAKPEFAEFIINAKPGYPYQDFRPIPLAAYDMESNPPRRLAVGFQENNTATGKLDGKWFPGRYDTEGGINATREFLYIFASDYSDTPKEPYISADMLYGASQIDLMYVCLFSRRGARVPQAGDYIVVNANHVNSSADEFTFKTLAPTYSIEDAKADIEKINVFPNPYYGFNIVERDRFNRFVTFSHLPQKAVIRIFTLAGTLVQTIEKDSPSQFATWNLQNQDGLPVASGVYIIYIDLPELGKSKTLKLALVREQQFLPIY